MKNKIVLLCSLLVLVIFAFSCNNNTARIQSLEQQVDSLTFVNGQQQLVLDDMSSYIAEISAIMDSINVHEGILTLRIDENGKPLSQRKILENLSKLEEILSKKRAEINRLDSLLNLRNDQVRNLTKMVRHLYTELDEKDKTIKDLKAQVESQNIKIRNLSGKVDDLTTDIAVLSDTLTDVRTRSEQTKREVSQLKTQSQRVYYVIGTTNALQELGVLTKEFFKKSTVNAGEFDDSKFTQADMYALQEIEFQGKNPKFMSIQPPVSSYSLVGSNKDKGLYKLTILDPDQFWNATKYLVIKVYQ